MINSKATISADEITDSYGDVVNCEKTYKLITYMLKDNGVFGGKCIIGWTDGVGTHFDILFVHRAVQIGKNIQGGIHPAQDLFVSVMRKGAFAFEVNNGDPGHPDFYVQTHPTYVSEKLGVYPANELTKLINGVRKELSII